MVGRPSRRCGNGQVAFSKGRDALPEVKKRSGGPPVVPGVVERFSWWSGSSRRALPEVREWSEGPSGSPKVVRWPSRWSGSGRETLSEGQDVQLEVQEWSGGHLQR